MQAARVQPAPVRAPAQAQKPSAPAPQFPPPRPVPSSLAGSKRKLAEAPQPAASKRRITPESTHTQPGAPAPSTAAAASSSQQTPSRAAAGDSATATSTSSIVFEQEASLHVELGREALPLGDQAEAGSRVLEAVQQGRQWRLLCHSGTARQWSDDVPGRITAVAGSLHFSAAGFQSGALQVCFQHVGTNAVELTPSVFPHVYCTVLRQRHVLLQRFNIYAAVVVNMHTHNCIGNVCIPKFAF